jgi:hypothetical protein
MCQFKMQTTPETHDHVCAPNISAALSLAKCSNNHTVYVAYVFAQIRRWPQHEAMDDSLLKNTDISFQLFRYHIP